MRDCVTHNLICVRFDSRCCIVVAMRESPSRRVWQACRERSTLMSLLVTTSDMARRV